MGKWTIAAVCFIVVAAMMNYLSVLVFLTMFYLVYCMVLVWGYLSLYPWMIMHHAYGMRKRSLTIIDGGYIVGGCSLMGLVLTLL